MQAQDSSLSNFTQSVIIITDVNDNAPTFSDSAYYGSVTELAAVNAVVMVIFASDDDLEVGVILKDFSYTICIVYGKSLVIVRSSVSQFCVSALRFGSVPCLWCDASPCSVCAFGGYNCWFHISHTPS